MAVSRRMFLQRGVLAAAACATTPLLALGSKPPVGGNQTGGKVHTLPSHPSSGSVSWQDHAAALDHLGRGHFLSAIGTAFKVTVEGSAQPIWVTLAAVNDLPALVPVNQASFAVPSKQSGFAPTSSGFVLSFNGSSPLPQGTHLFQHDALGSFALFTVPDGSTPQVSWAIVNRLDQMTVIAIPFADAPARSSTPAATAPIAPATSSATENPPRALSGSPVARRAAVRD